MVPGLALGGKQKNTERSSARAGIQSLYGDATLQSLPGLSGLCAWGSSAAMHKAHKSDAASYTASGGSDAAPSHEHAPHIIAKHIMPGPHCTGPEPQPPHARSGHSAAQRPQLPVARNLPYMLTACLCS